MLTIFLPLFEERKTGRIWVESAIANGIFKKDQAGSKKKGEIMENEKQSSDQPAPFTPGVTKGMVRQHAFELFRDKLANKERLTLDDWVMAEKDLVRLQQEGEEAS